jgi:hypothetical protein
MNISYLVAISSAGIIGSISSYIICFTRYKSGEGTREEPCTHSVCGAVATDVRVRNGIPANTAGLDGRTSLRTDIAPSGCCCAGKVGYCRRADDW